MFRSTVWGGLLAAVLAPTSISLNRLMTLTPQAQLAPESEKLSESLSLLSNTLVSFESRQSGSERELTKQLESLAGIVASTQQANQSQIDALVKSLGEVKQIAMQPQDSSAFEQLLKDFGKDFEKKMGESVKTLVSAEVEEALPAKGVGTLDVNSTPGADDGRPEDFADAARRIVALEKEVAALKARSTVSSTTSTASAPVYYSTPTYYAASGGCTGSYATTSYSQPVQQQYYYSTPTVQQQYYAPATRSRVFSRSYSAGGTCRIVNGVRICN